MSEFRFIVTLFFLISFLSLIITTKAEDPEYLYHMCPNTTTFTRNSTYQSNLRSFLSRLPSKAENTHGYYGTSGQDSQQEPNTDVVYGQFSCRGDVSTASCVGSIKFAVEDVMGRCPIEKEVVIWYDVCFLSYSNESDFSSTMRDSPMVYMWNVNNVTNPVRFKEAVGTALKEANDRTASTTLRFGTGAVNSSVFQTVYGLAQCTPQISSMDCNWCLWKATADIPTLCAEKIGGRVMTPSCYVRYEVYPFFNLEPLLEAQPPPTPVPTPPPVIDSHPKGSKSKLIQIVGSSSGILGMIAIGSFAFIIWRRRKNSSKDIRLLDFRGMKFGNDNFSNEELQGENGEGSQEFPSIQLVIINAATQNFCEANKLGEGGFGSVYKGILADGKEIAVKRLSKTSGQGILEFKNEVILIARLQHRNLVKLLGCCLESNEKLLVYEYMPNRSLDVFLFDAKLSMQLDWQKRFSIVSGIARGILYLHEDSRLKIIHRDLKASNILLDGEMNPKISDFGLARIFGGNQNEASTNRIVGTYGYMAPEYAMEGLFSIRSDVFSFGVLLLEIISGKKNNGFYFYERGDSLLTFAWKLWSEGQGIELIDQVLVKTCVKSEVLKCIHIGLLCVQKDHAHRPTMSTVIHMLVSETIALPKPNEPAFFVGRITTQETLPSKNNIICSVNELTLSNVGPR